MASINKRLAESNKSCTGGKATKSPSIQMIPQDRGAKPHDAASLDDKPALKKPNRSRTHLRRGRSVALAAA